MTGLQSILWMSGHVLGWTCDSVKEFIMGPLYEESMFFWLTRMWTVAHVLCVCTSV